MAKWLLFLGKPTIGLKVLIKGRKIEDIYYKSIIVIEI